MEVTILKLVTWTPWIKEEQLPCTGLRRHTSPELCRCSARRQGPLHMVLVPRACDQLLLATASSLL